MIINMFNYRLKQKLIMAEYDPLVDYIERRYIWRPLQLLVAHGKGQSSLWVESFWIISFFISFCPPFYVTR